MEILESVNSGDYTEEYPGFSESTALVNHIRVIFRTLQN